MEVAKTITEDYLHQNAFHEVDTYSSLNKQLRMMKLIIGYYQRCRDAINDGVDIEDLLEIPFRVKIGRAKYI